MRSSSKPQQIETETTYKYNNTGSNALPALPKTSVFSANLQELDDTLNTMMETSENMIKVGNQPTRAKTCKVCGKEGYITDIKKHIEANHLEGVSVPCSLCDKILRSRSALSHHISRNHKKHWPSFSRTRDALRQHRKSDHLIEIAK